MFLDYEHLLQTDFRHSLSSVHEDSYVVSSLTRDPKKIDSFPTGNYHVGVWFGNIVILSEPFVVE